MKILVIGAGVLGSLYASRLHRSGQSVTILARGERLAEIRAHGLVMIDDRTQKEECYPIAVTDRLAADDDYDLAIVLVRKNQLASVLSFISDNRSIPAILVMVNNAAGPEQIIKALGKERVLLGFPGAGGERSAHGVHYRVLPGYFQPTTIGELDGRRTTRIMSIAGVIKDAGFPVTISRNMVGWLQTHAALVSPIANAIYQAGGSNFRLAKSPDILLNMVRAVREQLKVLHAFQIPVTPSRYRILEWLPVNLLVAICRIGFNTHMAELVMARHANSARDEMFQIAAELANLAQQANIKTPYSDALAAYAI